MSPGEKVISAIMPATEVISHAVVLPDQNFYEWLEIVRPYQAHFEQVAVVRSPAGNDLNRYRNVTAVESPLTWMSDSALTHIRRVYPLVVLVDVIAATTPADLRPIVQGRIDRDDRYGEGETEETHLYDRFVLEWPTSARPMAVLDVFNSRQSQGPLRESMDIKVKAHAKVLCAAAGEVTAVGAAGNDYGYRSYLQIESVVEDERFVTIYEGVKLARVNLGEQVILGQVLAQSRDERLRIILQNPPDNGVSFTNIDNVINPRDRVYIPEFRVRPLVDNLRVRNVPSRRGKILGMVYSWDLLEPLEHHGRAIEKTGIADKWMKIRSIGGLQGYTAAWYLQATTATEGKEAIPGVNPVGVNLDVFHDTGKPDASKLGELGWVRFGYNVSNFKGSEDIDAALQKYLPLVESYREAGYRVAFTTSHQVYGEAKSQFWPWSQMTDVKWEQLTNRFSEMMGDIAAQWAQRDLVSAWQIWNEQDAPVGAVASVPMSAENYAKMFAKVHQAIRSADSDVNIITGGFTGGPGRGATYARQLMRDLPDDIVPDGIAFHPYGRGLNDQPKYAIWGHIDESVWAYSAVLPQKPLWMTEWGVLDRPHDDINHITKYATDMIRHLKVNYPGKFAALIWYAWAEGMHNGYGIVDRQGNARPPLTARFLSS